MMLCGSAANHVALANRLHAIHPLEHIAQIEPMKAKPRPLLYRAYSATVGFPLRNAWSAMVAQCSARYPTLPATTISRHPSVNSKSVVELVERVRPDLVLVSGTDLLRQEIIDAVGRSAKIMNLHTGISPYIKGGPNCTNWALALGEFDMIGNTVMWLDAGIDTGNIIATERTPLTREETLTELHRKVMDHAHELYGRCYALAVAGRPLPSVRQKEIAEGRLFYTKHWTTREIRAAVVNFYKGYRTSKDMRTVRLVSPEAT